MSDTKMTLPRQPLAARWGWLISIADQGLVSASNFLTLVIVSRALAPADVGRYALVYTGVMMVSALQAALVSTPHAVLSPGQDRARFLGNQFTMLGVLVLLQLCLFVPGLSLSIAFEPKLLIPASIFMVLLQFHELTRMSYLAEINPQTTMLLDACVHLPRLVLLGGAAALGALTLDVLLWIVAITLLVWPLFARPQRLDPSKVGHHAARSWAFGRFLLLESVAYALSTQAYLYAVNALLDLETVAGLAATQNLLSAVNVVFMGAVSFVLPLSRKTLLESGYDAWRRLLIRTAVYVTASLAAIVGCIAVVSEPLLALVYGPHYASYAPLLLGLALPVVLQGPNALAAAAFQTAERPEIGLVAKLAGAVFAILWVYPGITHLGVWGAIIGICATQLIWIAVYAASLARGHLSRSAVASRVTIRVAA